MDHGYRPHEECIRLIIGHHSEIRGSKKRFGKHADSWKTLRSWTPYLEAFRADTPFPDGRVTEYIAEIPVKLDRNDLPPDLVIFLHLDPSDRVNKARAYIVDELIPGMVPAVILDLNLGFDIPQDLRQHFFSCNAYFKVTF
ncbi:hypothetical protein MPH_12407 [Macrophomina phaseolina MS6]|uniref:Uncharacterized protein n=1 Tax=Macrophomina phaseolina (strain MS6) TaxID=1126212 RepID=K2RKC6_MACPH|nr:hypothetical protein MPH_12407 [Macrophomina phaseolina MS6]